jgi:hypothetical protein
MTKYHSKKVVVNGETFDSRKEYRRFCELSLLERAGAITNLQRQVEFLLIPAQWETFERYSDKTGNRLKDGRRCVEQKCSYIADFVYFKDGQKVVEDTKGVKTKDYIIKRKLMLRIHGVRIQEV